MADEQLVTYDVDGHVGTVSLNRPNRRNALTQELSLQLYDVLSRAAEDDTRVVVLRGEGTHFCVGGDLGGATGREGMAAEEVADQLRDSARNPRLLHTMPKVTIAAVQGAAAGAGLVLAMSCDLRLAERSAVFRSAFLAAGLPGDYGGSWYATRLLGSALARELYLLNEKVDASRAHQIGLVSRVVPDGNAHAAAAELATELAASAPNALRSMKANLNEAVTADLAHIIEVESERQGRQMVSADAREAAAAFFEKRPPVFTGA